MSPVLVALLLGSAGSHPGKRRKLGFFFWLHHTAYGILLPRPGIEPVSTALEAWSLNHWLAREVQAWLLDDEIEPRQTQSVGRGKREEGQQHAMGGWGQAQSDRDSGESRGTGWGAAKDKSSLVNHFPGATAA